MAAGANAIARDGRNQAVKLAGDLSCFGFVEGSGNDNWSLPLARETRDEDACDEAPKLLLDGCLSALHNS